MSKALATRDRDPFALARDIFGFDPFAGLALRWQQPAAGKAAFSPTFEVVERDDAYVVRADIPGVKDSDLDISLHNNLLTVSGARAGEERQEGETYYVYERTYGSFSRSFALPDSADGDNVSANLADGVLTVSIPKKAESKPRKIALSK